MLRVILTRCPKCLNRHIPVPLPSTALPSLTTYSSSVTTFSQSRPANDHSAEPSSPSSEYPSRINMPFHNHWFALYKDVTPGSFGSDDGDAGPRAKTVSTSFSTDENRSECPFSMVSVPAQFSVDADAQSLLIPTTMAPSELGGGVDDPYNVLHSYFGSQSVGAVLTDLAESCWERGDLSASVVFDSASLGDRIQDGEVAAQTRFKRKIQYLPSDEHVIPEEKQQSVISSVVPLAATLVAPTVIPALEVPEQVQEVTEPEKPEIPHRFTASQFSPSRSERLADSRVLRGAAQTRDLQVVRFELTQNNWPSFHEVGGVINPVVSAFIAEINSEDDVTEVMELIRDLVSTHPQGFVHDTTSMTFLLKVLEHSGIERVSAIATELRSLTQLGEALAPTKGRRKAIDRATAIALFRKAFESEETSFHTVSALCDALIANKFLKNRDIFLETAAQCLLQRQTFEDVFPMWAAYALSEHTLAGGNSFLEMALSDNKPNVRKQNRRVSNILEVFEKLLSPPDAVAQLIVSLIATGRFADAQIMMTKVSVDCRHFIRPIRHLAIDEDQAVVNVIHIRQFADLITACVLPDVKKAKTRKPRKSRKLTDDATAAAEGTGTEAPQNAEPVETEAEKENAEQKEPELPRGNVGFLLDKLHIFKRRKFTKASNKTRRVEVKPDQLEHLLLTMQQVWVKLAEVHGGAAELDEMHRFMSKLNVPLSEPLRRRVNHVYRQAKRTNPFELDAAASVD